MIITGKNPEFVAEWDYNKQCYWLFYKGRLLRTLYKFSDVKPYLE